MAGYFFALRGCKVFTLQDNSHEAIISPELFHRVQEQAASRHRSTKDNRVQIFSGLLRCGGCGRSMSCGTNKTRKGVPYSYYCCTAYRQYGAERAGCTQHYIRCDTLYACVLDRIREWAQSARSDENRLLQRLLQAGDRERAAAVKKQTAELNRAEKRRAELDRLFTQLYEDRVSGRITEYNFDMLSERYQAEQSELAAKLERLRAELGRERETADNAKKRLAIIRQYANPQELTAEMLNRLIEKIVIHEAVTAPDGGREQEIEIYYRFIGKID